MWTFFNSSIFPGEDGVEITFKPRSRNKQKTVSVSSASFEKNPEDGKDSIARSSSMKEPLGSKESIPPGAAEEEVVVKEQEDTDNDVGSPALDDSSSGMRRLLGWDYCRNFFRFDSLLI